MPRILYRTTRSRKGFIFAGSAVVKELADTLEDRIKPELLKRFKLIVANWSSDVDFGARKIIKPDFISVSVYPKGADKKIWTYVTGGTRKHPITARRAKTLAFMWGGKGSYKPKTKPVGKFGGPGIVRGGKMAFPVSVQHPGTKARKFEETIMEDMQPEFRREMENAFRRGINKASV